MPLLSKCPKCHQQVTVPDGLDPGAEVRCPLCVVVYPLREALAEAPPALIPVDPGAIRGPRPDSDALAQSDLISERFHVPESTAASVSAGASPPPLSDVESAEDEGLPIDDSPKVDVAPQIDTGENDRGSPAIDTGQPPVDADVWAGLDTQQPDREQESRAATPSRHPRRRKTEKSAIRFLLEVFLGGVGGLTIGYYALCWILGSQHGLPQLPLPLLPHTMHWFAGEQTSDGSAGKRPAAEPDAPPKRKPTQPKPAQPEPSKDDNPPPKLPPDDTHPKQPEPEPGPLPEDHVGPRSPPTFTSDELGHALKSAHDAVTAGADDEMTAEAYRQLCRLGEVITFVQGDAYDGRLASRRLAVRDLLKKIGARPGQTAQLGRLADARLDDPQRGDGGILLAGTAGKIATQGRLHGTVVTLTAHGGSITVLSDRPLPMADGDEVVILGSVVANPAENLAGYHGTKPQVVWVGAAVKLGR